MSDFLSTYTKNNDYIKNCGDTYKINDYYIKTMTIPDKKDHP